MLSLFLKNTTNFDQNHSCLRFVIDQTTKEEAQVLSVFFSYGLLAGCFVTKVFCNVGEQKFLENQWSRLSFTGKHFEQF